MNKKGMAFILTVSLLTVVLLIIFLSHNSFQYQNIQRVESSMIYAMNDFIKDVNSDMGRVIKIGGYRAFIAMEDYVAATGSFFSDTDSVMAEVLSNGTVQGVSAILMNDSSLDAYFTSVNEIMNLRGVVVDYEVKEVNLSHINPWNVNFDVLINIIVVDIQDTASWNYTKEFSSIINIKGLRDPLYSVKTENRVPNIVREQNQSFEDLQVLEDHIEQGYYIASTKAPSFLQRFENNLSNHEYGIESIVYLRDLFDQDIPIYLDRIKVDYMYFNELTGNKVCDFDMVSEDLYLVLTDDRIEDYGLQDTNHSTNC